MLKDSGNSEILIKRMGKNRSRLGTIITSLGRDGDRGSLDLILKSPAKPIASTEIAIISNENIDL